MIQKEEYRKTVDEQHASEELIQRTLQKISDEGSFSEKAEKKRPIRFYRRIGTIAAAAVLLLIVGSFVLFMPQNIRYSQVTAKTDIGGGSLSLGQIGAEQTIEPENLTEGLEYALLKNETFLPDGMLEGKTYTIEGKEMHFGEGRTGLFAAFSGKEGWVLYSSKTLSKKDFEKAVKKELQKLE